MEVRLLSRSASPFCLVLRPCDLGVFGGSGGPGVAPPWCKRTGPRNVLNSENEYRRLCVGRTHGAADEPRKEKAPR